MTDTEICRLIELERDHSAWIDGLEASGLKVDDSNEPKGNHSLINDGKLRDFIMDTLGVPPETYNDETETGFCRDSFHFAWLDWEEEGGDPTELIRAIRAILGECLNVEPATHGKRGVKEEA